MKPFTFINCAEMAEQGWNFVQDFYPGNDANWYYYSAEPAGLIERAISKPKISRIRACLHASSKASRVIHGLEISHLPRTTAFLSEINKLYNVKIPHLAFSFNFTELPTGFKKKFMQHAFSSVDQFVVYSNYEKLRYAEYFNIDEARIKMLHWAMDKPVCSNDTVSNQGNYICAVGGEGRDYVTLIEAMRSLPHIKLVIVTRPYSLSDIDLPVNVEVLFNISRDKFWSTVNGSQFVVVPLKHQEVACGHITIVGSFLLKKPIVTTYSKGTADYIQNDVNSLVSEPADVEALRNNIESLYGDDTKRISLGKSGFKFASIQCSPQMWANYIHEYQVSLQ